MHEEGFCIEIVNSNFENNYIWVANDEDFGKLKLVFGDSSDLKDNNTYSDKASFNDKVFDLDNLDLAVTYAIERININKNVKHSVNSKMKIEIPSENYDGFKEYYIKTDSEYNDLIVFDIDNYRSHLDYLGTFGFSLTLYELCENEYVYIDNMEFDHDNIDIKELIDKVNINTKNMIKENMIRELNEKYTEKDIKI